MIVRLRRFAATAILGAAILWLGIAHANDGGVVNGRTILALALIVLFIFVTTSTDKETGR